MATLHAAWQAWRGRGTPAKFAHGCVVEIFSKPDCHLCEVAKAHLQALQKEWGFKLREVNIANDESLLAQYGTRIPLVWVNGQLACKYKIDENVLRQKLARPAGAAREE
ncbi:MAG: glutaredoxin family protein [bacterium]